MPVQGASTSTRSKRGPERGERRLVARVQHLGVAHAGALQPLEDRAAAALCRRRRRRSGRCSAWPRRAPASCRRRLHRYRAPACAGRRRPAARRSASPRPAPRTSPCRAPVSASTLGCRAGPFGRRQAHADRRQRRRRRRRSGRAPSAPCRGRLQRVDAQIDRARGAPAPRPPRPRAAPNARSNDGASHRDSRRAT